MQEPSIRLGCRFCDRDDKDFLTAEQLELAKAEGWTDIEPNQTEEAALQTYDHPSAEPPGFSVFDWQTHEGTCPDCQDEDS